MRTSGKQIVKKKKKSKRKTEQSEGGKKRNNNRTASKYLRISSREGFSRQSSDENIIHPTVSKINTNVHEERTTNKLKFTAI